MLVCYNVNRYAALHSEELTLSYPHSRIPNDYSLGPDSLVQSGVPTGTLTQYELISRIYPGIAHDYWVYVPAEYDSSNAACVMVFQDGMHYANPDGHMRAPVVFDNLICKKELPVIIGIFVSPGRESQEYLDDPRSHFEKYHLSQRAEEYDVLGDRYSRFLLEEVLPEVGQKYNVRQDAAGRAICGSSSGGICAWTVAWERPDAFSKVMSHCGSFTDIRGGYVYPYLIRKTQKKPIRVFLQTGTDDFNNAWGNWMLANQEMASSLEYKGYDYQLVIGDGGHDIKHGGSILPESLKWLWRD